MRKDTILQADKDSLAGNLTAVTSSNDVFKKEMARSSVRDDLARLHGVYVSTVNNSAYITSAESLSKDGSHIMLDVYEWNWITYTDGKGGPLDEMGYATEHQIEIARNKAGGYTIVGDTYDESDILGGGVSEKVSAADDRSAADAARSVNGVNSSVNYKVNTVIDYADNWVIHGYAPGSGPNSSYYNLKMYGYYPNDCANFVSQCMRAGGMQWDYGNGKDNGNWDGTQWWFDINPNPNYDNYNISPPSWRKVTKFVEYWGNQGYATSVVASPSTVFPGNPVYDNNHVGICVGYNSAGIPICNAHTRDVYHVPYTMISTGGTQYTIQISTSNKMVSTPENAALITPTASYQTTTANYISAGANHYYTFTVGTAGYYTLESSEYENSGFDTEATLYIESQASNGNTLYMYEIAWNDDSETDQNFRIREYLSAGTYYLRVRAFSQTDTGYYYLKYKRG